MILTFLIISPLLLIGFYLKSKFALLPNALGIYLFSVSDDSSNIGPVVMILVGLSINIDMLICNKTGGNEYGRFYKQSPAFPQLRMALQVFWQRDN